MKIMENELGFTFYRVEYQGVLSEYKIIEYKDGNPVYSIAGLTDFSDQTYKLKENPRAWATSNFSLELIINKPDEYFSDIEEAKKVSKEKFDKAFNPNGKYRVARYFDDLLETYLSEELSKKEAQDIADRLNNKPRHYVYHGIVAVN